MRIDGSLRLLLVGIPMLMVVQVLAAQDATPAAAPAAATVQDATPAAAPAAATAQAVPAPQAATTAAPQVAAPVKADPKAAKAQAAEEKKEKKAEEAKKKIYTGPNTVIVLAPTPMLDEIGTQRLDPDGQPMFNPAVRQQRDKKGHPLFDDKGKPVFQTATELGYDEKGKKIHLSKVKPPKMTPVTIARGTFTVDGMIGKAELNYTIPDFKYMYLYAPGIGTLVVSNEPFAGATLQKNAFNDKTLTITTGDHHLQVASDNNLLGKKPLPAYVLLDRTFVLPTPYPVVGYGGLTKAPYVWPGSHENAELKGAFVKPPPIPVNLQPVLLLTPCPAGQMRRAAPPVLPGEKAPPQPCVVIPKGSATLSGPAAKKQVAAQTPAAAPVPATAEAVPAPNAVTPSPAPAPQQ
ncbi:hypothetical protein [Granulicella sp. L46]|uniref:hypothetical protein n=1 Tax=Granulicella sp. L46 TaxID=1641865 RepID=UPI00131D2D6A|nr:hypothetical protein [Granulicella sp. L46]